MAMLVATGWVGTTGGSVAVPASSVTLDGATGAPVSSLLTQWAAVRTWIGSMITPPQKASVAWAPNAPPGDWMNIPTWKGNEVIDGTGAAPTTRSDTGDPAAAAEAVAGPSERPA